VNLLGDAPLCAGRGRRFPGDSEAAGDPTAHDLAHGEKGNRPE
jgi:hypothetical protein